MVDESDVEAIREFCEFGEDRVYLLLAIARSKENSDLGGSQPTIREIVREPDEIGRTVDRLDHAVRRFDRRYRLYLTANARDALAATFRLRERTDDWIEARLHGDEDVKPKFKRVGGEYESVLQSDACRDETNFVFDLDDADESDAATLRADLAGYTEVSMVRETPNGYHVVTDPFDYNELETDVEYELKTDGLVFVSYLGE